MSTNNFNLPNNNESPFAEQPAYNSPNQQVNYFIPIALKEKWLAYLLWFFAPMIGAHQFYLKNNKKGFAYIIVSAFIWIAYVVFLVSSAFASVSITTGSQSTRPQSNDHIESISSLPMILSFLVLIFSCVVFYTMWLYDAFKIAKDTDIINSEIIASTNNSNNESF